MSHALLPRSITSRLIAASLLLGACSPPATEAAEEAPLTQAIRKREPTRVRTQPIVQKEMVRTLTTTTVVESDKEIELFPRVAGVVVELLAEEGDAVERDQPLARLDDREARAALRTAELDLRQAKEDVPRLQLAVDEADARLKRAKLAWDQAVRDVERNEKAALISKNDLDQLRLTRDTNEADFIAAELALKTAQQAVETAQTAIDRAALAVESAELTLSYTEILAPFDGVVALRAIKVGDAVTMSESAFTLTDPSNLRAIFFRPQRELSLFQAARGNLEDSPLEIQIQAEAVPGVNFRGDIQLVSPTIDASSGSFRVTVGVRANDEGAAHEQLLPGMLVRLAIITDRHLEALVVPKRALRREGDTNFVFTVEDGRALRHEVIEGFSTDEEIEILPAREESIASLAPGSRVVVAGNRDLEDGGDVLTDDEVPGAETDEESAQEDVPVATGESSDTTTAAADLGTQESNQ